MESRKLISVVVPVYCEEAVIEQTYGELTRDCRLAICCCSSG